MVLDLGRREKGNYKEDNYKVKFLSNLNIGDKISGEIYIGEVKDKEIKGKNVKQFSTILTDHQNEMKYIISIIASFYFNGDNDTDGATIYGEKGSRTYDYLDSLEHVLNGLARNKQNSHSYEFDQLREAVNENVETVTMQVIAPSNPNARTPNIVFVEATMQDGEVCKGTYDYGVPDVDEEIKSIKKQPVMVDDLQARTYIKEIINETGISETDYDAIAKSAENNKDKWDLSDEDVTRIKKQLAFYKMSGG